MHICIATAYHVSAYYGGNEYYAHHLALSLCRLGHQVTYLTTWGKPGNLPYRLIIVPVKTLKGHPLIHPSWFSQLSHLSPDVFHFSGSGLPLLTGALMLKCYRPHIPRLLTYQADSFPSSFWLRLVSKAQRAVLFHLFDHVITTTPWYQKRLQTAFPHLHVYLVPLFVSPEFIPPAKPWLPSPLLYPFTGKHLILFIGQLDNHHYYKGLAVLLKALTLLPASYHLLVIGNGNQKCHYEDLSRSLGIAKRVMFIGNLSRDKLPRFVKAADCFVLPSTNASEGCGLVAIEAMAQGIPVITTTAIGAAGWFKKEKVAILIPPHNAAALAKAIAAYRKFPMLQRKRALHFAQGLTQERMAARTLKVYENITR